MILRLLLLVCVLISPSFGLMDGKAFREKFETQCFLNSNTELFKINGQEVPLSNTLENFIAMAEKFEIANKNFDLKAELVYFISEYLFENIKFSDGKVTDVKIEYGNLDNVNNLWNPDPSQFSAAEDPFTDDEKCSLYHMISHSLLQQDKELMKSYSPVNYNSTLNRAYSAGINPADYYPQEIGVVAIRGTDAAVSLGKVLVGMYVGLLDDRMRDVNNIKTIPTSDESKVLPSERTIDLLQIVTLADVMVMSQWPKNKMMKLTPNGKWIATHISSDKSIEGFCPMVYKQQELQVGVEVSPYSYSSVRGAADGLILGLAMQEVYREKSHSKLSQILRMYYSPDGITLKTPPLQDTGIKRITFCERQEVLSLMEDKLNDHMSWFGFLTADQWQDSIPWAEYAKTIYRDEKHNIFENVNTEIRDYCKRSYNMEKPEDLPRETYLDVIVVMDSSNTEHFFQIQQMIVGEIAKQLELRYTGSRMTILLDHKVISEGDKSSKVMLESVVFDTYSSSCAACTIGQITYEPSTIERDVVISAIDQFLQERKDNETNYNGIGGKVVIYFNYGKEEPNGNNNKIQGNLAKALRSLHLNHQDVFFYAVGLELAVLRKYAKNDPSLTFLATNGTREEVAKDIAKRITFAPALLQYNDCEEARNEKSAVYENFVSPHKIQHYEMPAKYFYKSTSISFFFESENGYIKVCFNRATMRPENEANSCKNTTGTGPVEFKVKNPCKNFQKESCSPFYFSIMGMDKSPDAMRPDPRQRNYCENTNDHWCSTLDQIKYKVSHTGIRCSGCLGLNASTAVILFTVLLTYFVQKRF